MTHRWLCSAGLGIAFVGLLACSGGDTLPVAASPDGGSATGDSGGRGDGNRCPTATYRTLVIVGDSISDVGAGGGEDEEPFYRTLLVKNDDALYPDWKGRDVATCWGLDPAAGVVKVSKGGAVGTVPASNTPSNKGVLLNQVASLPKTLEGPVLVVGTIGGNDVGAGLVAVVTGTDAQHQAKIDAFTAGFGAALANLTKPDRFGAGVKVDVLMTNIYDPSGGTGHFYYAPKGETCPGRLGLWPDGRETTPALVRWNTAMANEAAKYPSVKILDLHALFEAHRVDMPAESNWFHDDCTHPSSAGHAAIRGLFWAGMAALP